MDITGGATVTIENDDVASVTIADVSADEDGGAITVTATLDFAVQGGFTVEVNTADGSATIADSDYSASDQSYAHFCRYRRRNSVFLCYSDC